MRFFYPDEQGRREIASLCHEVFNGRYDRDMFKEYGHWLSYITDIYLPICDSETGDFRMLPFEGSITDQPYMTMQIIRLVQMNYRKHLNENMKKVQAKIKSNRKGLH